MDNIEYAIVNGLKQHYKHLGEVSIVIRARWDFGTGFRDNFAASVLDKLGDSWIDTIGYVDAEGELFLAYRLTYEAY